MAISTPPAAPNPLGTNFAAEALAFTQWMHTAAPEFNTAVTDANAAVGDAEQAVLDAAAQVGLATTQAGLATTNGAAQVALAASQVTLATTQASNAATSATTATTQAGIATTKAGEASTSAATATTQAGIATTKAAEAAASAASIAGGPVPEAPSDGKTYVRKDSAWSEIIPLTLNNLPALRPSLLLDFANSKQVDPRITFTRASTATYFDAQGVLRTAGSGVPRIDHNPVTGECRGLLIEEARTNLLTYSEQFDNAAWTKVSPMTIGSANSVAAPDGSVSADVLSTTNAGSVYQDATASGTGTYTTSIYVHTSSTCASASITCFFLSNSTESFGITINPSTGSLISAQPGVAYSIMNCGNGWFRYAATFTGTNAANTFIRLQIYNNSVTANTLVVWGAQLE